MQTRFVQPSLHSKTVQQLQSSGFLSESICSLPDLALTSTVPLNCYYLTFQTMETDFLYYNRQGVQTLAQATIPFFFSFLSWFLKKRKKRKKELCINMCRKIIFLNHLLFHNVIRQIFLNHLMYSGIALVFRYLNDGHTYVEQEKRKFTNIRNLNFPLICQDILLYT